MPRPERPLDPSAGPIQAFAADLRKLRERAGNPKYLQMARVSGRSRTALAEAAGGYHLPTWETTEAYVTACGEAPASWRARWEDLHEAGRRQSSGIGSTSTQPETAGVDTGNSIGPGSVVPASGHTEVLLRMWQEQRQQARQSENQRALMSGIVVVVALCMSAYVTLSDERPVARLAVSIGVVFLGLFGMVVTAKYYERFTMHMDAAQRLRSRLDEIWPQAALEADWLRNRTEHSGNFAFLYRTPLHHLWLLVHIGVASAGAISATVLTAGI
ncbi:hypothetical protein [Nocardia noduli]|uniref:hypothetical protein n=1 Tax=Nocardia noduli TaxID=2815722 RepID=UPI001C21555E|nr:hypothetical protein [Nocardia noduli]